MRAGAWAMMLAAVAAAGCAPAAPTGPLVDRAASGPLAATLSVDRQFLQVGEDLHLTLTARNAGGEPLRIIGRSGAPVLAIVWRYEPHRGWIRVKQYPEAATMQLLPWDLPARAERTFEMTVPVSPDWPCNQQVRLSAELNGRPDARPYVLVGVLPCPPPSPVGTHDTPDATTQPR